MYRKATEGDCRTVYDFVCSLESRELPYDSFSQIFRAQTADKGYYCLLREEGGKPIGMLNLRFEYQLHHAARIAEILEFTVLADFRNQGIGKEMLQTAFEIAKQNGCVQIEVASNQLRTDAHRFYQREGMKNFHYKLSKSLTGDDPEENRIGR